MCLHTQSFRGAHAGSHTGGVCLHDEHTHKLCLCFEVRVRVFFEDQHVDIHVHRYHEFLEALVHEVRQGEHVDEKAH